MMPDRSDLHLSQEDEDYLQSCARIRQISCTRLIHRLMKTICTDQLVLSVLDDDSKPLKKMPGEIGVSRYHRHRPREIDA